MEKVVNIRPFYIATQESDLEPFIEVEGIKSTLAPFRKVNSTITYPRTVIEALGELYCEYNATLRPPVMRSTADYQRCDPTAFAVQIDMPALPQPLLDQLAEMPVAEVREILRGLIFEIESSIAMYQLLERIFATSDRDSRFGRGWRSALDNLRKRHGKPVALLAVTDEKYKSILATELGIVDSGVRPSPDLVQELTGFDALFGPEDFRRLIEEEEGDCPYVLFVRASDPPRVLGKPTESVDHPLLSDPDMVRLIRANTVTMNIDEPDAPIEECVNDTKSYLSKMGMALDIQAWEDLSVDNPNFCTFLETRQINPEDFLAGRVPFRAKPMSGTGSYGHIRGVYTDRDVRSTLRRELRRRGLYVVQMELPTLIIRYSRLGIEAGAIDRNFFAWVDGKPMFIGGFRNCMPVDSSEFKAGRIHGGMHAFWAEIS